MESTFLAVVLGAVFVQVSGQCNLPPSLWCSTRDAARLCQVEHQCERSGYLVPVTSPGPVNFTLYYESLCAWCQDFFQTQLLPAFERVGQIMNITLVPYGYTWETKNGSRWDFKCEHGPPECVGNIIESCAIYYEKIENYLPFITCIEASSEIPAQSARKCAEKFPVAIDKILSCSNSSLGNELEHQMALKNTPTWYIPWVTVNGVHTEKIETAAENDLVKVICETFQGVKPSGCKES